MPSRISVVVTTYNHEDFLGQCLQSILDQTGHSDMEIIVGDDCSTDGTRLIAQQFQRKNPQFISLLTTPENLGVTNNLKRCLDACTGEYIAICEGDDYWTHPGKLQAQKDLLTAHREYSMCFCAVTLYYQDQGLQTAHPGQAALKSTFLTTEDLIGTNSIGTFSCCMYRADVVRRLPPALFDLYAVDWMFNMACGEFGRIGFIPDRMCVYRLHSGGAWTGKGQYERLEELGRHIDEYNAYFAYKYDTPFKQLKRRTQIEMQGLRRPERQGEAKRDAIARNAGDRFQRAAANLLRRLRDNVRRFRRRL